MISLQHRQYVREGSPVRTERSMKGMSVEEQRGVAEATAGLATGVAGRGRREEMYRTYARSLLARPFRSANEAKDASGRRTVDQMPALPTHTPPTSSFANHTSAPRTNDLSQICDNTVAVPRGGFSVHHMVSLHPTSPLARAGAGIRKVWPAGPEVDSQRQELGWYW